VVSFTAWSPYPRGKSSVYPLHRGRVSLRASLDAFEAQKNHLLLPKIELRFPVRPASYILGVIPLNNLSRVMNVTLYEYNCFCMRE
jgi:hypothetical protein